MPELPEVEVVRRGLEAHVVGLTIGDVEVLHPRPVRRHVAGPADFARALAGRRLLAARRRGKFLWLPLDTGDALLVHLGMSGQMLVQPFGATDERHLRVRFGLRTSSGEASGSELRFVDQRMFGGVSLSVDGAELPTEAAHIARDPLDPHFDDAAFARDLRRRTSAVKRLLLDQRVISGVGNIYADEALWATSIHGERRGDQLTGRQALHLVEAVRAVMLSALDQGGTSFDALYVNVNGESGYFDRSLHAYGQEGLPCQRCGAAIVRTAFMNRSSFWCPRCQPKPRVRRG